MHFLCGGSGRKDVGGHPQCKNDCQHIGPGGLFSENWSDKEVKSNRA